MQVKVCPKCKSENRSTNAACSNCYASLESVAVTESAGAQPVRSQPRPPKPAAPPASTQQMPAGQQMPPPQQTQMGTMSPPPGMPGGPMPMGLQPVKRSSPAGIIALVIGVALVVFGGLIFAVMQSGMFKPQPRPTESPAKAALAYLEAKKTGKLSAVEPFLSQESISMVHNTYGSKQAQSAGLTAQDAADRYVFGTLPTADMMSGKEVTATELKGDSEADEHMAIVDVEVSRKPDAPAAPKPLVAPGATPPPEPEKKVDLSAMLDTGPVSVELVLVAEGGKWKVDLGQTARRHIGLGKSGNPCKLGK